MKLTTKKLAYFTIISGVLFWGVIAADVNYLLPIHDAISYLIAGLAFCLISGIMIIGIIYAAKLYARIRLYVDAWLN